MILIRRQIIIFLGVALLLAISISTLVAGRYGDDSLPVSSMDKTAEIPSNFSTAGIIAEKSSQIQKDQFFVEYRLERERLRSRQVEMLNEIVHNPASEKEARQAASLRLVEISRNMEREMQAESLVKSKGFEDCVIVMQPEGITAVVKSTSLPLEKEKEIQEMVSRVTESDTEKISIVWRHPEEKM